MDKNYLHKILRMVLYINWWDGVIIKYQQLFEIDR